MVPALLRQESVEAWNIRGLEAVITYHRQEIAQLHQAITKARSSGGFYRRRSIAQLRRRLRDHRCSLTGAVCERRAWAGTASPTACRRFRWRWAIKRLRQEIWNRWTRGERMERTLAYSAQVLADQRFKPATLRAYARDRESWSADQQETIRELQLLSEVTIEPYYEWAHRGAIEEPYLDGADAWLRRQLEGLGKGL